MTKFGTLSAALAFAATAVGFGGIAPSAAADDSLFKFNELVGIPQPFTGMLFPIRGVPGGGLPWVIDKGEVKLSDGGELKVEVEGLVIDPAAASQNAGSNPVASFKAIVSCLTVNSEDAATTVNVETGIYPATIGFGAGDSKFKETLVLPDPCIAPIVFVTSPNGSWFAASGF